MHTFMSMTWTNFYNELQNRRAKILEGPVVRVYGVREVIVEDLNGYKLAFGERANISTLKSADW
jgi:hypothetical protein